MAWADVNGRGSYVQTVTAIDDGRASCDVWLKRGDDVVISGSAEVDLPGSVAQ